MKAFLVHYGEIALKGGNRRDFERMLVDNIRYSAGEANIKKIERLEGRIAVYTSSYSSKMVKHFVSKLSRVFGISWFSVAEVCESRMDKIKSTSLRIAKDKLKGKTFKVDTKRSYKKFPHTSIQTNEIIGEALLNRYKSKVSLDEPDVTVFIEITKDKTFVHMEKTKGLSGLPVGSAGKVLVLLSGGIDSAAAAWLVMKRGCRVDYLHIHALRRNKDVKDSKINDIFNVLKEYDTKSSLYTLPYHEFDVKAQKVPSDYNLILFRRFMIRIAENLAGDINAKAIVMGDNLSQVASQTIESIGVADNDVGILIFRPLLTYDKEEIIQLAGRIGTYGLSIKDYKDCCSIISRHPATRPKLEKAKLFESKMKMESVVRRCSKMVEMLK